MDENTIESYLDLAVQLTEAYPDTFVGFDLVGQEDLGRPLVDFADQLIAAREANPNLTYFFHAGETDWQGQATDLNVMDALLLDTKRIGHGYAIVKVQCYRISPKIKIIDSRMSLCSIRNPRSWRSNLGFP